MLDLRFDLRTPRDLLEKLRRENARFDADPCADHLFNFVVTAWSLVDWLEKEWASADSPDRKELINDLREHKKIRVCRDIANGNKHFSLDPSDRRHNKFPPEVTEAQRIEGGYGVAIYGRAVYGVPAVSYRVRTLDEEFDMFHVMQDTLQIFDQFFSEHDLE